MGRGGSELELRGTMHDNPALEAPVPTSAPPAAPGPDSAAAARPPHQPPRSGSSTCGTDRGMARNSGMEGRGLGKEAGISRGREEGFKKPSGSRRKLGPQDPGGRSFGNPGYPRKESRSLRDGGGFQAQTQAPPTQAAQRISNGVGTLTRCPTPYLAVKVPIGLL